MMGRCFPLVFSLWRMAIVASRPSISAFEHPLGRDRMSASPPHPELPCLFPQNPVCPLFSKSRMARIDSRGDLRQQDRQGRATLSDGGRHNWGCVSCSRSRGPRPADDVRSSDRFIGLARHSLIAILRHFAASSRNPTEVSITIRIRKTWDCFLIWCAIAKPSRPAYGNRVERGGR